MNEQSYKKRLDIQNRTISRQSKQIEELKLQNEKLKLEIKKNEEIINSITPLKDELMQNAEDMKKYKEEYRILIHELRKMKEILNQDVYKGRWKLIKFLLKIK